MDDSTRDEQEKAREQAQDRAQEKGTEATFFDPFADDDDEPEIDLADLLGTPAPASAPDDAGEDSAATSATPIDPFADAEDSDPGAA
ncbi:MAG: serine/threonine protein kinase, partial [Corynebacterium variabile]|nr:serine/threonine protein kinase [Corynebacterium variabile]